MNRCAFEGTRRKAGRAVWRVKCRRHFCKGGFTPPEDQNQRGPRRIRDSLGRKRRDAGAGTQAEDALTMKKTYWNFVKGDEAK